MRALYSHCVGRHPVCAACGSENPAGARFCNGCGAALTAPAVERRKLVTSVFCDLSGSTAMAEAVDAETVFEVMRTYFDTARAALERHGGAVEKFIGDAVVGMFGVPEAHEDDALRACRAALEIQGRLATSNLGIAVRIGVNTGEVVAGDAARREMFASGDAVVLGDSVNVAARLEQAAAPGEVLIGEATYRLVRGAVEVEAAEAIAAKGKTMSLVAYRLLAASDHGPLPRRAGTPLVGRDNELALLEEAFQEVVASRSCGLLTVVGEPGVGKSRLAAELLERIGPARTVRSGCLSYGEGITYWAIAQIVRALAGIRDEHSPAQARSQLESFLVAEPERAAITGQLAQLLGLDDGVTTSEELAWAVRRFLTVAASERALVVLLDDIHWAEPALLELITGLPSGIGTVPVLIVCLARPELLEARPDWEATVRLEPLGAKDVDALLESLDAPAAIRVRIAQAAAGNPLFVEELAAWVHEGGDVAALPTSLNALLGARLDGLDPEARDALERGAVEGELFHEGTVVELSDEHSRPAVPGELGALARKDLIRLAAAGLIAGEVAYRFKHILVRDAAYHATTKKLRAILHERFADWLEHLAGDRVAEYHEILGYHLEQARHYRIELGAADDHTRGLGERAAHHLASAGRRASDRGDYHAAANLLERAIAIGGIPRERVRSQLELIDCFLQIGRGSERAALAAEALAASTHLEDRALAARARIRGEAIAQWQTDADLDAQQKAVEEAIETLTELDDQLGLAEAYRSLGQTLSIQGRGLETLEVYERSLAAATAAGAQSRARDVIGSIAYNLALGPTRAGEAIRRCEQLIHANRDDRVLEAVVGECMALPVAMTGRADEALALVTHNRAILDELDPLGLGVATWFRDAAAAALVYAGDRAGARRELEARWQKLEAMRHRPSDGRAVRAAYQLALLYCDEERWDDVDRCLAYGGEVTPRANTGTQSGLRLAAQARLAAHRHRHGEAVTLAHRAVEASELRDATNFQAQMWETLAGVQWAAGNSTEAGAAAARAIELYEQKENVVAASALRSEGYL